MFAFSVRSRGGVPLPEPHSSATRRGRRGYIARQVKPSGGTRSCASVSTLPRFPTPPRTNNVPILPERDAPTAPRVLYPRRPRRVASVRNEENAHGAIEGQKVRNGPPHSALCRVRCGDRAYVTNFQNRRALGPPISWCLWPPTLLFFPCRMNAETDGTT